MKILVADDSDDQRELLAQALSKEGWEVFTAKDGRDALRVYHNAIDRDKCFDVIVMDVVMPRLNGFAMGVNLRNLEKFSDVPRAIHIYLTGCEDAVPRDQLLESELMGEPFVDAYMRKPIDSGELIEKIRELVREAAETP